MQTICGSSVLLIGLTLLGFVPNGPNEVTAQSPSQPTNSTSDQWLLPVPELEVDAEVPTSKQVLRYDWGEDISSHYQIETYLRRLAKACPDRTKLVQYGESSEGRSLNYLVISSPENIANLDEVNENNLKLADPRTLGPTEAVDLIENNPAVIWLAYCVHGNEVSPSDAALLTAYHLLADKRAETKTLLENLVVIIDPLQNPDGRDRFVNVFRETRGLFIQSYPAANEHTERWPSGRSNHYWFDMNRDWFRHSQKEVKAKVAAYLSWQPQIYVDAHEMGRNSSFYFPPPADPKNPYLLESQHDWFTKIGKHQAGWFDKYGFGYMTREQFDAFYPGYGSEWPTLQGGLGILWEQASARGQVIDRDDETKLSYADGVRNHYISGVSTLEFAAANRQALLRQFYDAKSSSIKMGRESKTKHYFIRSDVRPQRSRALAAMLVRNGIEVRTLKKSLRIECTDVKDDQLRTRVIPVGSFHIPAAQPIGRLLRSLLDREVEMDKKFLRRQLERNELRMPDEIYDVTAWSMPLAFDVECLVTAETINPDSDLWNNEAPQTAPIPVAKVAYLIPGTDGAIEAMSELIQGGVRVHVADEKFTINGRPFTRGTLIVKTAQNPKDLDARIRSVCSKLGVEAFATDTAFVDEGAHMGGPSVHWVRPPKVLLVVHRPTSYSSGHTWYLFDQVLKYPTTRVKGSDFGRVELDKFNTIVLPDGRYRAGSGFGKDRAAELAAWVRAGGTLITLRGATEWAAGEEIGLIKNRLVKRKVADVGRAEDDSKKGENSGKPEKVTPDNVPGAFFRANTFQQHWVTFGYRPDVDVFYSGRLVLSPTKETAGRSLVTFAKRDELLTSGFCWPASLDLIAETPYVVYRRSGSGHVIAFTDDPNYRAMYPSLQRLFINAAMFGAAH